MPRIFDNIKQHLRYALIETLEVSNRADFCVGYFNLRGWRSIDNYIENWKGGEGNCCRLLVGMQRLPHEDFRIAKSFLASKGELDNQTAARLKSKLAEEFREQLNIGYATNEDEAGLRKLARQLKTKKVVVRLFLKHSLHAKLYLLYRSDPNNPVTGYLGSSNLTQSGLSLQGELNIDVLDHDACEKLANWFEDRWNDRWCIDITDELARILETSWAREDSIPPYHIYIKIAYHLSQEARTGLTDFRIPKDFENKLLDFQTAAVKIAAHHLNKRGGVLIGDVVGLGKTLMATALARIFEDDHDLETLIICPKNLVPMWEDYQSQYRMRAKVLSISKVINELPKIRRYRLVIIDESHNLRNREGKKYRSIQEYIRKNDCKCILLTATPYNKEYYDLSSQLRLFVPENLDIGIRPERMLREIGETEFIRRHQAPVRSLAALEQSEYADDWRELMRLYLVRRTRSFIQRNYAETDPENGRKYLTFGDGSKSYFPVRVPKTIKFEIDEQYSRLFAEDVVDTINRLELPRYGLGNYISQLPPPTAPSSEEEQIIDDLSRAGKRLMGFCRTNLFKRLESSGFAFLLSVEWHILRNYIFLHALENNKPLPIGSTSVSQFSAHTLDHIEDSDLILGEVSGKTTPRARLNYEGDFQKRAAEIYNQFYNQNKNRLRWLNPYHFDGELSRHLKEDAQSLLKLLAQFGTWQGAKDAKLNSLHNLLVNEHQEEKVLIFTQFSDTVHYLHNELLSRGLTQIGFVTGSSTNPTEYAWRFSPQSNEKEDYALSKGELRVLVATDVLSEGQNLQDCSIVVNFDLPWAIISLIQRAGRVDRIGQKAHEIICYSFLPAEGIEKLINLRKRVKNRLEINATIVGTDEEFFEGENKRAILDLYNERTGILDGEIETEVDLSSYAFQIWKNATDLDPPLKRIIEDLPPVVYSSKHFKQKKDQPEGVLAYMRTPLGNDTLAWINHVGKSVTENQYDILRAAECSPETPTLPRHEAHHELVLKAVEHISKEEKTVGGQLGRPSGARFRTYERLKFYVERNKGTLLENEPLRRVLNDIYRFPLRQSAIDTLNRQLRSGISDESLGELTITLRDEDRLCFNHEEDEYQEPQIICSLGLIG